MADSAECCCRNLNGSVPNFFDHVKLALTDGSCCLGHTDVVVGHAPKRQVDILETRYNVYETLADCVVVATDDHAGITGVYCVVVDEILAKFLFQ